MASLERFVAAQAPVYARVLDELHAGCKSTHWMWYVFPQIAGLGHSDMARHYAIANRAEAEAYLAHPVLGARLAESTQAVTAWGGRRDLVAIFGSVDALKFRSAMTLFEAVGATYCARALDALCGGTRDQRTLQLLG